MSPGCSGDVDCAAATYLRTRCSSRRKSSHINRVIPPHLISEEQRYCRYRLVSSTRG